MDPFVLKVALSFFVGGIWVAAATLGAERFGTRIGGFLGGLPSTAAVSLFFIAWTQGGQAAFDATTVFPLAFAVNALFFLAFVILVKGGFAVGLAGAITTWVLAQFAIALVHPTSFGWVLAVWALIVVTVVAILIGPLHATSVSSVRLNYPPLQVLWRAAFGGLMVGVAVIASRLGGPLLGGIFSTFPAVNISTLIITSRTVDTTFSRAIVTPLLISSEVNCVAFSLAFRYAILAVDPVPALLSAYGLAMITGALTFLIIQKGIR